MSKLSRGDRVRLISDSAKLRTIQERHGEYHTFMSMCLGKIGVVESIATNGKLNVAFDGTEWCLHHLVLEKVGGSKEPAPAKQRAFKQAGSSVHSTETKSKLSVGDEVRLIDDGDKLKSLQKDIDRYDPLTKLCLGKTGTVKSIERNGEINVTVESTEWCLHPDAVINTTSQRDTRRPSPAVRPPPPKTPVAPIVKHREHGKKVKNDLNECALVHQGDGKYPKTCSKCKYKNSNVYFKCGHGACDPCYRKLVNCPECSKPITKYR